MKKTKTKAPSKPRFAKPLSKEEANAARKANISKDEFRYRQACSWAILMGEDLPDKRKFMADLARKRANAKQGRK